MIPQSFIESLLQRIDIVDIVDAHVPLKKAGANYAACCPFHSEKTPSFTVSPQKQFYHCFGCGAHGTAIGFMMAYAGLGFVEAVEDLAGRLGLAVPAEDAAPRGARPAQGGARLQEVMARAAAYYRAQLRDSDKAIDYLKRRGLDGAVCKTFGIGYAPAGWQNLATAFTDYATSPEILAAGLVSEKDGRRYDRFRDRLMFPIINQKGEVIAFGGRVIDAGEPKYLNSPETPLFEKGRELFGLPQARIALRETGQAVVVEGYMDVVALARHGVGNAVATLGTATTAAHLQKLLRQVDSVVFCFDGDAAGRKAAWRALDNALGVIDERKSVGFVFLPEAHDPDSFVQTFGEPALRSALAQATPLSDFFMRELAARVDLESAEGRARLLSEAKPLLQKLQTPLLRLQLVKRLAEVSAFSQAEVERLCGLRKIAPAAPARAPRQSPAATLIRRLLRLILQKPALAQRLPLADLPKNTPEAAALGRLIALIRAAGEPLPGYAQLLERLRGGEDAAILEEAAANLLHEPFADEEIEAEFEGTLAKFSRDKEQEEALELRAKAAALGVAGLSDEEKKRYLQLLASGRS